MEVEFKREMNRNYMVLKREAAGKERHTIQMLTQNRISGLLPFHEKKVDGDCWFYYDITSRQPLERILEYRKLSGAELRRLIADLLSALKQLECFLLDESQLCLEPDMIYVEPDSFQCCLCVLPGRKRPLAHEFCTLSQYLLEHVNQNDGEAVVLAFAVFKESRKENFGIEDIEACLRRTGNPEREETKKKPSINEESGERETERKTVEKKQAEKEIAEKTCGTEQPAMQKREVPWKWLPFFLMAGIPVFIGVLWGIQTLFRYKWLLGTAELLLILGAVWLFRGRAAVAEAFREGRNKQTEEEWSIYFQTESGEEACVPEPNGEPDMGYTAEKPLWDRSVLENDEDEEGMQTILLTGGPNDSEIRKLIPMEGGPEIPIRYFPFLIGKSKDIVDCCIDLPEISRLHLKIEKISSGYSVTDLNSTNGTRVNGHLLAANETYPLISGDELMIAAVRYRFL